MSGEKNQSEIKNNSFCFQIKFIGTIFLLVEKIKSYLKTKFLT